MILIKSFLTGVFYDRFKLIYAYLFEGDNVSEYYRCFKMTIKAQLHADFFKIFSQNVHHLNLMNHDIGDVG